MAQQIDLLKNTSFEGKMDSLIEAILKGENYDYVQLMNKPSINGYTLEGNKTNAQLGIPTKTSDITNDSGFIEDKNYVHTDENFTSAEKTKLDSVENGAEANVQANWSETDSTEDSFIKNKPTIPSKTSELSNDSNFVVDADYKHTDNNYTTADKNSVATIGDKVDKVTGKELSTNDLTDTLKANYDDAYSKAHTHTNKAVLDATTASFTLDDQKKLTNIESGAQKNTVTGVKGSAEEDYRIGNVNITKTNVGLENVVNERQWSANNHPTTMSDYGITDGVSNTDYTTLKGRVDTNEDNIAMLDSEVEGLNTDVSTLKTDMTTVKGAVTTIQGDYVPKTRKVNGKALNTDITLSASDVRAIASTLKGAKNGVAELDANGLIPSSQLPSYVDDVLEYDTKTDFPTTGESGKIYIATNTNLQYRWTGTQYVEISSSLALGETSSTAYRGDRGKTAYDHSQKTSGNPHNVTKSDVGLENVGNFKAVSTVASQGLTDTEKANARANIGAGTGNSNFSGAYADLSGKPTLGTAASKDVASTGNASTTQVVMGNDTRLSDSRKASDVYAWAKVKTKPSYTKSEVGLGNVPNVTTNNQTPTFTKAGTRDLPISGETLSTIFGKILKWFSDLKSVAFSGSYKDLSDTPNFLTGGSQTTTSTADGGNNVFTFTKADGTNATFTVKNGSKGSTGTDGTSAGFGTPTASIDANVGTPSVTVTASGSNTAKVFNFAFKNLKGSTGARGTRGSVINYGTAITGTSTTATAFSSSGLTSSLINDMYINTSTFYLYRCTVAGNAANAKWVYVGSIKGAKGDKGDNATTTATGTASTAGLTKLYTGIGTATDGTMTQAAIKSVLGGKANSSHDHNRITSKGKHDEIASGTTANAPTAGMADATAGAYVTQSYGDSSAPSKYGNILNVVGQGTGQLFMGWSAVDNTTEHLYYRSHRDTSTGGWGKWNTIIDSSNIGSQSVASATKVNGHTVNSDVPSNAKFTDTTYNDATTSAHGLMTAAMVRKLNGIATNANSYSLPTASSSTLGGVKVGSGLKITNGVLNLVWQ